jgi:hypothetical protein
MSVLKGTLGQGEVLLVMQYKYLFCYPTALWQNLWFVIIIVCKNLLLVCKHMYCKTSIVL